MVALDGATSETKAMAEISSVTDLVSSPGHHGARTGPSNNEKKMTYNEWRQIRKRRKLLYKAPVCKTRLESLKVEPGYTIRLSVEVMGFPAPSISWYLDNEELEMDEKFEMEHEVNENRHSLIISQITPREAGCYMCYAENSEGSDSTVGFITVKDSSRQRRKRSVSQRPHISTIKEFKEREEDTDPQQDRLLLRNRQCWDWTRLSAASDDDILDSCRREDREGSCDLLSVLHRSDSRTEAEWEETRESCSQNRSRSRSLPPESRTDDSKSSSKVSDLPAEKKVNKLKSFWELKTRGRQRCA